MPACPVYRRQQSLAVVRLEGCAVVAAGLLSEVKVAGDPVPTEGEMPAWAPALAGAFWAARRARAEAEAAHSALTAHQVRLERIVNAAHEYADDNDLCSRFDDFMMENGLDFGKLTNWLNNNGGYCDCKVMEQIAPIWRRKFGDE